MMIERGYNFNNDNEKKNEKKHVEEMRLGGGALIFQIFALL